MAKTQAKQGWGLGRGQDDKLDITQKQEKKTNIWEQQFENQILIPDLDDEQNNTLKGDVALVPKMSQKMETLAQLQEAQQKSLPKPIQNIDFGILLKELRPYEELDEPYETWEFQKLKTEIYQIVSNLYGTGELNDYNSYQ